MAEWTGRKRTLNSIIPVGQPPVDAASDHLPPPPDAPGAIDSPQLPGATPDTPNLPEKPRGSQRAIGSNRRPLTEYGSAQRFLRLFTPEPGADLEASDWEQGPAAFEEMRKGDPAQLTPFRPLAGYGLGIGHAASAIAPAESEAISGADEPLPAVPSAVETTAAHPASITASLEVVPAGALRSDGSAACPPGYPVKGNAQSKIYHTTESPVYESAIPEFCFSTVDAAEAAGFRAPHNA